VDVTAITCASNFIDCTSFFPSKPLGCYGDGGACFTNDDALAGKMRQIRVHGQDRRYHHPVIGFNGRLDTLQAAILLAKLTNFDAEVEKRAAAGNRYTELLGAEVKTPGVRPYNMSVYAQYTMATGAPHDTFAMGYFCVAFARRSVSDRYLGSDG
jgi:UDP-2-acetamido-2-deoxy-ribo-hexuluronate aminotransferase